MSYAAIIGTVISVGGGLYAGSQQKKAAGKQASALKSGTKELEPVLLGDPNTIDIRKVSQDAVDVPYDNLGYASELARAVNRINYGEALRYYSRMQKNFRPLQDQIGENALSFSRGELPADVVSSIGRAAAQRGIQGGYGMGSQGARSGMLGNLNLRNLGLTSLDLARFGTQLGMNVNAQAKALLSNLSSPTDWLLTPQQILNNEQNNVGFRNQFMLRNNELQNDAALQNTNLANSLGQTMSQMAYEGALGQAKAIGGSAQQIGGALLENAGLFGGQGQSPSWTLTNTQADVLKQATNAGATAQPWYINAKGASGLA